MDIVERLRDWGKFGVSRGDFVAYSHSAADEIERLREENNDLKSALRNVLFAEVSHVKVTEFTKDNE